MLYSNIDGIIRVTASKISISGTISNNPVQAIKDSWDDISDGYYLSSIACGAAYIALIQRISYGQYGCAYIMGYGLLPKFIQCVGGEWK